VKSNKKKATPKGGYNVGYAKPPTKSMFQKGKSGNPSGRPKGSKNSLSEALQPVFDRTVTMTIDGKTKKIPLIQAMGMKVLGLGMNGDPAFMKMAFGLYQTCHLSNDNQVETTGSSFELTPEEQAAISKSNLLKGLK
jgi:hypothetical protein